MGWRKLGYLLLTVYKTPPTIKDVRVFWEHKNDLNICKKRDSFGTVYSDSSSVQRFDISDSKSIKYKCLYGDISLQSVYVYMVYPKHRFSYTNRNVTFVDILVGRLFVNIVDYFREVRRPW